MTTESFFDEDQSHHGKYPILGHNQLSRDPWFGGFDCDAAQEIPAELKSCKAITDDKERLQCFDGLFGSPPKPPKPLDEQQAQNPPEETQANWSIDETKSQLMEVPRCSQRIQ